MGASRSDGSSSRLGSGDDIGRTPCARSPGILSSTPPRTLQFLARPARRRCGTLRARRGRGRDRSACARARAPGGNSSSARAFPSGVGRRRASVVLMRPELVFTPELKLTDGRTVRNIEDAIALAREHEARPGVDQRDEVLHALENANSKEQARAAAHLFLRWLEELQLVR